MGSEVVLARDLSPGHSSSHLNRLAGSCSLIQVSACRRDMPSWALLRNILAAPNSLAV